MSRSGDKSLESRQNKCKNTTFAKNLFCKFIFASKKIDIVNKRANHLIN